MRGFQPKKQREASEPAPNPAVRGFAPGHEAALAQAQNQAPDSIPAMVKPGEFVLPPDTVHAMGGTEALQRAVDATHEPAPDTAIVPRGFEPQMFFAQGGSADEDLRRRVGTIPTGGLTAPAPDGSQDSAANTEVGRNVTNTLAALPGAAAVPRAVGFVAGAGSRLAGAAAPAASAAQGVAGYAPPLAGAAGLYAATSSPAQPPAPAAPAAATPTPRPAPVATPNPADQRLATGTQAPAGGATGAEVQPGVFKHGPGQYSDQASGMGFAPGFTGQPSAQSMGAGDNVARGFVPGSWSPAPAPSTERGFAPAGITAPTVRHSGNDWQARNDLRSAKVSADSITNTRRWGGKGAENNPDVMEYQALLRSDMAARGFQPGMDQEAMRQNGALQREGLQQDGATQRAVRGFQVDQQRVGIEGRRADSEIAVRGFQTRAALQQEELRGVLTDPNSTQQQKTQAQQALQALTGKGDSWKAVALQGGTDAQGNKTESILGAVNERTGEMKRMEGQGAEPPKSGPALLNPSSRPVGTVSTVGDKTAVWDGQKWVPRA
ncbi:hypothetical protein KW843_22680 [Acidovorax sp. sif1233]|uniref:hypothetical protein n=1 Tax=Acidovorax sp. sif1233 TaxID=2854792 RepID=UPI001C485AD8|nr:hypothetical protein [Acidovorax sp. sif1233]MBV7457304.1 hypothetical protein [Acidovorax sp. sif1233]